VPKVLNAKISLDATLAGEGACAADKHLWSNTRRRFQCTLVRAAAREL
jgi:hypothetical protein